MTALGLTALSGVCAVPAFLIASRKKGRRITLKPLNQPILLDAPQMIRLIKRECARIDRNGLACALAVFAVPDARTSPEHRELLLSTLHERARLTDVVGWLDDNTLCVFLTDATQQGAQAFAEAVKSSLAAQLPALKTAVHNYDGRWANLDGQEGAAAEPVPALAMSA